MLASLALSVVSLVIMDPPYHGVLDEEWDTQWATDGEYLEFLRPVIDACESTLADNGTLYAFSSSRMCGRVEALVSEFMTVISSCVWDKGDERQGVAGTGIDVASLRAYWPTSERCLVAEKRPMRYLEADEQAKDASGYWSACEAVKRSVFGDYLAEEFKRAGVTNKQIAALFPSRTGGLTGCVSNWILGANCPTAEQYETMRGYLNAANRDEYLRKNYEYLRKNYEDLRKNYEDLRRPFMAKNGHQWGDVWRFSVPKRRDHPAEKPGALIAQIVEVSSRPSDLVLDPFAGSGTSLVEAKRIGRRSIGVEQSENYCAAIANRLRQGSLSAMFQP